MAVTLLKAGDYLSLEFDNDDLERVGECIRDLYPNVTSRWAGIFKVYCFGGCEFTFQNEWDDPCLIASSDEGHEILRVLHARLTSN